jgi:hypothetical protein
LHPGLYLSLRAGAKRKMIHVPQPLEGLARQWVGTYQETWRLMEQISQSCLKQFGKAKAQSRGERR